ncbi:MAG: winged helix-turn-helix transcriptional regulator [Pelomonas sp.]|nr:winged helix-turn-helix transcriptional regulator [Roseateles sp.]
MTPPQKPRFIFLLNSAQRALHQCIAQEQAQAAGGDAPSPAQAGVLFALASADGQTMGQLAQALDLAPSAVSGLIQRMEALDWVARHADAEDARSSRVCLRAAGRAQLPALRAALARLNAKLGDSFSDAELQTVARWLEHVRRLGTN